MCGRSMTTSVQITAREGTSYLMTYSCALVARNIIVLPDHIARLLSAKRVNTTDVLSIMRALTALFM